MCRIIECVGSREVQTLLLDGLERLELPRLRLGGIALLESDELHYTRAVGNLQNLKSAAGRDGSPATTGLSHALGDPRRRHRAEPAPAAGYDSGKLAIVLNGIVENYRELRERLLAEGRTFASETDAETVTHLIEAHDEDLVSWPARVPRGSRATSPSS